MDVAIEVIGWFGAAILLLAYFFLSMGDKPPGPKFQAINGIGSAALLVNGAAHGAWPSVALNTVWFAIAVVGLLRWARASRGADGVTQISID
jgi:hypothetical protein